MVITSAESLSLDHVFKSKYKVCLTICDQLGRAVPIWTPGKSPLYIKEIGDSLMRSGRRCVFGSVWGDCDCCPPEKDGEDEAARAARRHEGAMHRAMRSWKGIREDEDYTKVEGARRFDYFRDEFHLFLYMERECCASVHKWIDDMLAEMSTALYDFDEGDRARVEKWCAEQKPPVDWHRRPDLISSHVYKQLKAPHNRRRIFDGAVRRLSSASDPLHGDLFPSLRRLRKAEKLGFHIEYCLGQGGLLRRDSNRKIPSTGEVLPQ